MKQLIKFKTGAFVLLSFITYESEAGAPFQTDDPETTEENKFEVNYSIVNTTRNAGYSSSFPNIDINYGLSKDIQLHLQPRYSYEKSGGVKSSGFDGTEIGLKYRFYNQYNGYKKIMVGIYPKLVTPGDSSLGVSRKYMQAFLPVWLQLDTEAWTLYGGLGYKINSGDTESKNSIFSGVTALYHFSDNTKLGAEVYTETPTSRHTATTSGFNLGVTHSINEYYHVLFSIGRSLNNIDSTNQLSAYLGLQVIY